MWPYYFMDYHWWDTTAEKLFLIFLSTGNAVLPIFCSAHFGWRDICCQVDLLFSDTFVLARGHFVTARLQSLLPKYNYWKVLNCNWKSNCSDDSRVARCHWLSATIIWSQNTPIVGTFTRHCSCVAGLQFCSLPHTDLEILLQSSGFLPHSVMAVLAGWLTLSR